MLVARRVMIIIELVVAAAYVCYRIIGMELLEFKLLRPWCTTLFACVHINEIHLASHACSIAA